jgi:carbonic anhydrase
MLSALLLSTALFAAAPAPAMNGWDAFSSLQNGNMRFYEGKPQRPRQDIPRREELANGQKPHTIVLSCSDSRLPPEIIFDQGLGDIFTVRVAGNIVDADAIASIEYAVEHIGSRFLLVMGHESCGAVTAAIESKPGISNGSESLDELVRHIREHLSSEAIAGALADKSIRQPVKENVTATLKELLRRSEIVREAVKKKGLVLAQGIYSLRTGRVEFWDVGSKFDVEQAAVQEAPAIPEQKVIEEVITDKGPKKPKAKATAN